MRNFVLLGVCLALIICARSSAEDPPKPKIDPDVIREVQMRYPNEDPANWTKISFDLETTPKGEVIKEQKEHAEKVIRIIGKMSEEARELFRVEKNVVLRCQLFAELDNGEKHRMPLSITKFPAYLILPKSTKLLSVTFAPYSLFWDPLPVRHDEFTNPVYSFRKSRGRPSPPEPIKMPSSTT